MDLKHAAPGSSPLDCARVCGQPADTDPRLYAAPVAAPAGPVPPLQPPGHHPAVVCRHAGRVSDPGFNQVIGSGSVRSVDPDSVRSVDPDPFSESGSGSRRAKMTHKRRRKKFRNFMFWSAGCSLLRAEGFFCHLNVFYGGLGIGKLYFLMKDIYIFFQL